MYNLQPQRDILVFLNNDYIYFAQEITFSAASCSVRARVKESAVSFHGLSSNQIQTQYHQVYAPSPPSGCTVEVARHSITCKTYI